MDENSSVLSQDAIDALLNSQVVDDSEEEAPAEESALAPEPIAEAAPEPVTEAAPEPTPVAEAAPAAPVAQAAPPPAPVVEAAPAAPVVEAVPATPAAPEPVMVAAPPPPGVTPPPGVVHVEPPAAAPVAGAPAPVAAPEAVGGVTEEQAMMIAGEAAEAAIAPVQGDIGLVSGRVDALEAAIAKIQKLEVEIATLKSQKAGSGGIDLETLRPLVDRLLNLEKGAKNSPLFNLYEKFTCSSCDNHGAAQARARCGKCGKEGWFGRKEAA